MNLQAFVLTSVAALLGLAGIAAGAMALVGEQSRPPTPVHLAEAAPAAVGPAAVSDEPMPALAPPSAIVPSAIVPLALVAVDAPAPRLRVAHRHKPGRHAVAAARRDEDRKIAYQR